MYSYEAYEDRLGFYTAVSELAGPYREWQLSQFLPHIGRRVADLGCGVGNFAELLLDRDLYLGIDMDPEMIGYMSSLYRGDRFPNVEFAMADIASPACLELIRERNIDTIISLNVIEHIEDDVAAINLMVDALPAGGSLCVLVPAFMQLYGTLDMIDYHFRRYEKADLLHKLDLSRLSVVKIHYFNLLGALGWFFKGRVLKNKGHTRDNFSATNRLIPIMRSFEKHISVPFGLSLVLVAIKNR